MMSSGKIDSNRYEVGDTIEAIEFCYAKGWTDGLPVVPPAEGSIRAMLDAAGLEPRQEITFIEQRHVSVTAEKVAINAVMAGCKPQYMPVIVAALEAIGDPRWGYHGPATSTGGSAVFLLVNGPIARELGMNCGDNLFGPGFRANATIGRAVRLVMRNVIGTLPGLLDRSTLGHGGKYSFCIAENEGESPWPPVHVERGFRREQNAVTALAALAPHQFYNQLSNTPEGILTTACAHMCISAGVGGQPQYVLVIAGEHMRVMAKEGWSKDDIKRFCFENTRISHGELKRINVMPGRITPGDKTRMRPLVRSPKDLIVVAAGSSAGAFSAFIPGWGSKRTTESVTVEIRRP
jgi:hypothetical protein